MKIVLSIAFFSIIGIVALVSIIENKDLKKQTDNFREELRKEINENRHLRLSLYETNDNILPKELVREFAIEGKFNDMTTIYFWENSKFNAFGNGKSICGKYGLEGDKLNLLVGKDTYSGTLSFDRLNLTFIWRTANFTLKFKLLLKS